MARPSDYTIDIAAEICGKLAEGKSLRAICASEDMPGITTVYRWLGAHREFREQYALAREDQGDTYADEIVEISDTAFDKDSAAAAKVRVDARKWVASKLKPKRWGDAGILAGTLLQPIQVNIAIGELPAAGSGGECVSTGQLPAPGDPGAFRFG